jgi:hypothetical protein
MSLSVLAIVVVLAGFAFHVRGGADHPVIDRAQACRDADSSVQSVTKRGESRTSWLALALSLK